MSSLLTRGFSFWQSAAAVFAYVSGISVSWAVTSIVVRNRHTGHTSLNYSWIAISEIQNTFAVMVAIVWWCSLSCGVPIHSSEKSLGRTPHAWTLGSSCLLLSHSYPEGQKKRQASDSLFFFKGWRNLGFYLPQSLTIQGSLPQEKRHDSST